MNEQLSSAGRSSTRTASEFLVKFPFWNYFAGHVLNYDTELHANDSSDVRSLEMKQKSLEGTERLGLQQRDFPECADKHLFPTRVGGEDSVCSARFSSAPNHV